MGTALPKFDPSFFCLISEFFEQSVTGTDRKRLREGRRHAHFVRLNFPEFLRIDPKVIPFRLLPHFLPVLELRNPLLFDTVSHWSHFSGYSFFSAFATAGEQLPKN